MAGLLRVPSAQAQFSDAYDPDFAPSPSAPRAPRPAPTASQQAPPELPATLRSAGPFLLLDRRSPERFFSEAPATAPAADFDEFLASFEPFRLDAGRWNKMREDFEYGLLPRDEIELPPPPPPSPYETASSTAAPLPARPEVEMPAYGTSLSITGRKVIGFSFSEKSYMRDQVTTGRAKSTNLIDITQQLQLRMQGKVGPKITVNVDYDDTKANKQDISVVYQGESNEVVQNASFGDIDLSLPSTEFVSYNKQLFGIRVELKYRGFNAIFIGSRTKGTTKTKQFKGNTQFTSLDIADTAFVRRQYYDLSFTNPARLPIRSASERVFLSRQGLTRANVNQLNLVVDDLTEQTATFTATFYQLSPGSDYVVDYVKGILTFRNSLEAQDVIAVDFIDATGNPISIQTSTNTGTTGGTGRYKLVKTFADTPIVSSTTESGYTRELKTFYNVGRTQIVRDDGRGNFFLKVLDLNRVEVGPSLNFVQKYPDTIGVDFENGIFRLDKPFSVSNDSPTVPDPEIYAPVPISKRLFQLEMRFRLKTFFLEPNLVLQSETVVVDGKRLARNVDYFVDYESGFLTFFNEDRITDGSVIDVSYEVAPFAGGGTESLLGTRVGWQFDKHFGVGSTLLYQTGAKPPSVPTVNDLAKSLLVYEGDFQAKDIRLLPFLTGSVVAEIAQSRSNPNLSKRALIENMEGIKQDDIAPTFDTAWQVAANPTQGPADPNAFGLSTVEIPVLQINPGAQANSADTQKVLQFNYDLTAAYGTEASAVYSFSTTGLDFSQKTMLEVTMNQDAVSNNEINFHLGGINEDADGSGILRTEDPNNDGILQPGDDIGFLYAPSGKASRRYGANNGRIDTEDLNRNGRLDPEDFTGGSFGYNYDAINYPARNQLYDVTSGSTRTVLDFKGWHTFQIPLSIAASDVTKWTAIKQIRISIRKPAGGTALGAVQFARIAAVGNVWQRGQAGDPATAAVGGGTITIKAVNNIEDPGYLPIFRAGGDAQQIYDDLYESVQTQQKQTNSSNVQEQSLEIRYGALAPGTTVYTKRVFTHAIDISQHRSFVFLLYGNVIDTSPATGDKTFFLRAGADKEYFEVQVPVNFKGWRKILVNQADLGGDQIPDTWTVAYGPPGTVAFSTGSPKLQQIGGLTAGVYSTANGINGNDNALWLDEIHLADPIQRAGTALKVQGDFQVPGWASFGFKHRWMDRNYQTPTTVIANQDNMLDTAYLNIDRLSFFPMRFNLTRTLTDTPNTNATGNLSNLVSLMQQGRVTVWNGSASGALAYGAWPRVNLSHTLDRTEYEVLTRKDQRKTYTGSLSYGVPRETFFLPRSIDANASLVKNSVSFQSALAKSVPGNYDTDEFTTNLGLRAAFVPWSGSSFNPSWTYATVKEDRRDYSSGSETRLSYDKSRSQALGFSANFRLLRWLNPSVNYNVNTIENYLLTDSTVPIGGTNYFFRIGEVKTVNRSANGSVNLTLAAADILPKSKLLRSLTTTNGYQLQDGDVYNYIEGNLPTRAALWVRTPLRTKGPAAQRTNQTLRDTVNSSQRWSLLDGYDLQGRKAALKTLSISNNFVKSIQRSDVTGTLSKTVTTTLPDLLASLSQLERLLFADRWMRNGQINLKYSAHRTENTGQTLSLDDALGADLRAVIAGRFDSTLSCNLRTSSSKDLRIGQVTQRTYHEDATLQTTFDVRAFRFTPKVDYQKDVATQGDGTQTQNTLQLTPSMLVRSDLNLPKGLKIPFSSKLLTFTNRVIWTTTLSLAVRKSPVAVTDNSKLFSLNTNADYEIAKNLRMSLNGSASRYWHTYLKEEDYLAYQFGTTLTFQF